MTGFHIAKTAKKGEKYKITLHRESLAICETINNERQSRKSDGKKACVISNKSRF